MLLSSINKVVGTYGCRNELVLLSPLFYHFLSSSTSEMSSDIFPSFPKGIDGYFYVFCFKEQPLLPENLGCEDFKGWALFFTSPRVSDAFRNSCRNTSYTQATTHAKKLPPPPYSLKGLSIDHFPLAVAACDVPSLIPDECFLFTY